MSLPLVIYHKQLGDVLLLEPALARLAAWCGGRVHLATRPGFAPLLGLMAAVDPIPDGVFRRASQVISFDYRSRACVQALMTWAPVKQLFVMAEKQLRAWQALCFPQGRQIVGEGALYRAEYFFRLVPGGGEFRPPRLAPPPPAWRPESLPDHPYMLIHATSAWRNKCWPAEAWAQAIDALQARGFGPFVVTGGNADWEKEFVDSMAAATRVPLINLCGRTGLEGYLATIAGAAAVLCIDGSAAHLAAALGRPTVVMFGPSNPEHWYYPAPHTRLVDARCFVAGKRPPVSAIPGSALVDSACELMEKSRG